MGELLIRCNERLAFIDSLWCRVYKSGRLSGQSVYRQMKREDGNRDKAKLLANRQKTGQ